MVATDVKPAFALTPLEPAALLETRTQIARAVSDPQVAAFSRELDRFAVQTGDEELAEYERIAILGVSAGFAERQLSPFIPEHVAIVPPLLAEIRAVLCELRKLGTPYSPGEFRARAFHYGVHKASYLDWRLYLSRECY